MKAATLLHESPVLPSKPEAQAREFGWPSLATPGPYGTGLARLADYVALGKPRVAVLVLFTVGAGVLLASVPVLAWAILFHAVFGTALVATGASASILGDPDHLTRPATRPRPAHR